MQSFARGLVSKKKRRYKEHGFDLDLSYITPRIIAMGFPSEGAEGIYRNPLSEVLRLLTKLHDNHYLVFNLCSERAYDAEKFNGHVERIPFDDHQAAPLESIHSFCVKADAWLGRHPQNVIVVHCKAGKGRSGLMICALMLFQELMPDPDAAFRFYADKRTKNGKGVTIASQRRYVRYYNDALVKGPRPPVTLRLVQIKVTASVAVKGDVIMVISSNNGTGDYTVTPLWTSTEESSVRGLNRQMVRRTLTVDVRPLLLMGDVKVQVFDRKVAKDVSLFYCWFNTSYVEDFKWAVQRDEMDKPAKHLEDDLRLELSFNLPPTTSGAAAAREQGAFTPEVGPSNDGGGKPQGRQDGAPMRTGLGRQAQGGPSFSGAGSGPQDRMRSPTDSSTPRGSPRAPTDSFTPRGSPRAPLQTPSLRDLHPERRTASLGIVGQLKRVDSLAIARSEERDTRGPLEEASWKHSPRVVEDDVKTSASPRVVDLSLQDDTHRLKADLASLREELEEEKQSSRSREEDLASRLAAVLQHAEERERQLRAQHETEMLHMQGEAHQRERQREGDDVRWRERENELLVALANACERAQSAQDELKAETAQVEKLQEEVRVLRGQAERLRAKSLYNTEVAPFAGDTCNGVATSGMRSLSPRRAAQTISSRPASESAAEALRLSSAAWRIRAASEGLVGRAWHEPNQAASNEVMVDLQESVTRMQTLMHELKKEQNVNGKLNAQIQSFLSGMASSSFPTRVPTVQDIGSPNRRVAT